MAGFNLGAAITGVGQGFEQNQDNYLKRQEARQQIMQNAQAIQAMQMKLDEAKKEITTKAVMGGILGGPDLQYQPFNIPQGARHGDPTGQGAQPPQPPQQQPMTPPAAAPPGQSSQPMAPPSQFPSPDAITQAFPGSGLNSGMRAPQRNAQVGGQPNSWHLSGNAQDLRPPPGMSTAQFAMALRKQYPNLRVIDERTHVHIQPNMKSPGGADAQRAAMAPQSAPQAPPAQQPPNAAAQPPGGAGAPQNRPMDQFGPQAQLQMLHQLYMQAKRVNPNLPEDQLMDAVTGMVDSMGKYAAILRPQSGVVINELRQDGESARAGQKIASTEDMAGKKLTLEEEVLAEKKRHDQDMYSAAMARTSAQIEKTRLNQDHFEQTFGLRKYAQFKRNPTVAAYLKAKGSTSSLEVAAHDEEYRKTVPGQLAVLDAFTKAATGGQAIQKFMTQAAQDALSYKDRVQIYKDRLSRGELLPDDVIQQYVTGGLKIMEELAANVDKEAEKFDDKFGAGSSGDLKPPPSPKKSDPLGIR